MLFKSLGFLLNRNSVPTHVRRLHLLRKLRALPSEGAQPIQVRGFGAALKQPLQPQADAQQRPCTRDTFSQQCSQSLIGQRRRRLKVAHSRNDPLLRASCGVRVTRYDAVAPEMLQRIHHRGQISRAIIDNRNHSSPFVLGSIRPSCLSFEHATRSALANALNSASIL